MGSHKGAWVPGQSFMFLVRVGELPGLDRFVSGGQHAYYTNLFKSVFTAGFCFLFNLNWGIL